MRKGVVCRQLPCRISPRCVAADTPGGYDRVLLPVCIQSFLAYRYAGEFRAYSIPDAVRDFPLTAARPTAEGNMKQPGMVLAWATKEALNGPIGM